MMGRHMLYCLSHLAAFIAGTALTYYSIAQQPEQFNRFPIPLSELLTFYKDAFLPRDRSKENQQAGRSAWEYLAYRAAVDRPVVGFLNCSEHLFERQDYREWFAKFRKENKLWHMNHVKLMLHEECQIPNLSVPEWLDANTTFALERRLRKELPGLPPEVIMEEVRLRLYIPKIDAIFRLGRDAPGLGKVGDLIWLVSEDTGRCLDEHGPFSSTPSTCNFYFINARTGQMVALFPPLRPLTRVSHVPYAPDEMKPPKK